MFSVSVVDKLLTKLKGNQPRPQREKWCQPSPDHHTKAAYPRELTNTEAFNFTAAYYGDFDGPLSTLGTALPPDPPCVDFKEDLCSFLHTASLKTPLEQPDPGAPLVSRTDKTSALRILILQCKFFYTNLDTGSDKHSKKWNPRLYFLMLERC